jgi:CPA2 family monovalent cation:H+ antiporter-2
MALGWGVGGGVVIALSFSLSSRVEMILTIEESGEMITEQSRIANDPARVALTVGIGLAQVGEFSFILGTVGLTLGLLPADGFQLIVAGALFSIALNPLLFRGVDPLERRLRGSRRLNGWQERRAGSLAVLDPGPDQSPFRLHAILCGYGQVGRMVGGALERRGFTYVVITQQRGEVERLRARGIAALYGEASSRELLERAHVDSARVVIIAGSDPHVTHLIVDRAREINPSVDFVVRTQSDDETASLRALSSRVQAVHSQRELAVQMARYSLRRFGINATEAEAIAQGLRRRPASETTPVPRVSRWTRLRDGARRRVRRQAG